MYPSQVCVDLTAQELLDLPPPEGIVEVDDIGAVDPLLRSGPVVANADERADLPRAGGPSAQNEKDGGAQPDSVEIELTAAQMLAMLEQS